MGAQVSGRKANFPRGGGGLGHIKHLSQGDGYLFSQGPTPGPEPSHGEEGKGGRIQAEEGDRQPGNIAGSSIKHLMKLP